MSLGQALQGDANLVANVGFARGIHLVEPPDETALGKFRQRLGDTPADQIPRTDQRLVAVIDESKFVAGPVQPRDRRRSPLEQQAQLPHVVGRMVLCRLIHELRIISAAARAGPPARRLTGSPDA